MLHIIKDCTKLDCSRGSTWCHTVSWRRDAEYLISMLALVGYGCWRLMLDAYLFVGCGFSFSLCQTILECPLPISLYGAIGRKHGVERFYKQNFSNTSEAFQKFFYKAVSDSVTEFNLVFISVFCKSLVAH